MTPPATVSKIDVRVGDLPEVRRAIATGWDSAQLGWLAAAILSATVTIANAHLAMYVDGILPPVGIALGAMCCALAASATFRCHSVVETFQS